MSKTITELAPVDFEVSACLAGSHTKPFVVRGLVAHWPVVSAATASDSGLQEYLLNFYSDQDVTVYHAAAEAKGRIFYDAEFSAFNFARTQKNLRELFVDLGRQAVKDKPDTYYMGSTMLDHWFPDFRKNNDLDFAEQECLVSLWLGNQTRVAPHFDFPENIACVVAGERTFTLYPPDQIGNLYAGSIDFSPSGQPISMVDVAQPDYQQFPKFADAQRTALTCTLYPGDAIYIPSMWWHQVESHRPLNALVNYWWRQTPSYLGSPLQALKHCLLSMNGLSSTQRRHWQDVFNYYLFDADDDSLAHIPESIKGSLGELDREQAQGIRQQLRHFLK